MEINRFGQVSGLPRTLRGSSFWRPELRRVQASHAPYVVHGGERGMCSSAPLLPPPSGRRTTSPYRGRFSSLIPTIYITMYLAEREGFEPSIPLLAGYTISNRAPSASRASLRAFAVRIALSVFFISGAWLAIRSFSGQLRFIEAPLAK